MLQDTKGAMRQTMKLFVFACCYLRQAFLDWMSLFNQRSVHTDGKSQCVHLHLIDSVYVSGWDEHYVI